jgi:hypothetical protein
VASISGSIQNCPVQSDPSDPSGRWPTLPRPGLAAGSGACLCGLRRGGRHLAGGRRALWSAQPAARLRPPDRRAAASVRVAAACSCCRRRSHASPADVRRNGFRIVHRCESSQITHRSTSTLHSSSSRAGNLAPPPPARTPRSRPRCSAGRGWWRRDLERRGEGEMGARAAGAGERLMANADPSHCPVSSLPTEYILTR